jgi:hypothetical protein
MTRCSEPETGHDRIVDAVVTLAGALALVALQFGGLADWLMALLIQP